MKVLAWVEEGALAKVREADPVAADLLKLEAKGPCVIIARVDFRGREPAVVNEAVSAVSSAIGEHLGAAAKLVVFVQPNESIEALDDLELGRRGLARREVLVEERALTAAFRFHMSHEGDCEVKAIGLAGFDPRKHCSRCRAAGEKAWAL